MVVLNTYVSLGYFYKSTIAILHSIDIFTCNSTQQRTTTNRAITWKWILRTINVCESWTSITDVTVIVTMWYIVNVTMTMTDMTMTMAVTYRGESEEEDKPPAEARGFAVVRRIHWKVKSMEHFNIVGYFCQNWCTYLFCQLCPLIFLVCEFFLATKTTIFLLS